MICQADTGTGTVATMNNSNSIRNGLSKTNAINNNQDLCILDMPSNALFIKQRKYNATRWDKMQQELQQ